MAAWNAANPSASTSTITNEYEYRSTGRDYCIAHASTKGGCAGKGTFFNKQMPEGYIPIGSLSSISRSDRAITLTHSNLTTGDSDRPYRYNALPGCVWVHRETGTVLFVRSANTATGETVLEMQNNYYWDGANWQILDTGYDPQTANYYSIGGLLFTPSFLVYGTLTAGSNVITDVNDVDGAANLPNWGLEVGDRIGDGHYPFPLVFGTNKLSITGIDTTARTITLSGNMDYSGRIPLPFWFRQPPANEASR